MTTAIRKGETINPSNPRLVFFNHVDGLLADVVSLEWQAFNVCDPTAPTQVEPVAPNRNVIDVNADRLGVGRYAATWSVPSDDTIEPGAYQIRWFVVRESGGPEIEIRQSITIVDETEPVVVGGYVTISDMRLEGVPGRISDDQLRRRIASASRYVEMITGRFFEPRYQTIKIDGRGGRMLLLDQPIIAVESVTFDTSPYSPSDLPIDPSLFRVYNRHLSQGLFEPDDRDNPKIVFYDSQGDVVGSPSIRFDRLNFPTSTQNVTVTGVFGYTDNDGSPAGVTPDLLRDVVIRLVFRNMERLIRTAGIGGSGASGAIVEEKTRDQMVKYADPTKAAIQGAFTGDPEIDTMLAAFVRPPRLGAA